MTKQTDATVYILTALNGDQRCVVDRELTVGRDTNCDVVVDQGRASRQHAQLAPAGDGILVTDLQSTNGTHINDQRITEPTVMKEGDQLRCGEARFELSAQAPAEPADPDATLLYSEESDKTELAGEESADNESSLADTQPEPATEEPSKSDAPEEDGADAQAPPSWVLQNQQSVDGTAFISKDELKNSLQQSGDTVQPKDDVAEPTLVGTGNPVMGVRFQLIGEGKEQWEIGRSANADVMINDESVSGSHAQILHENGRWKLVDLMSANGTYSNGKKCLSGYLSSGDQVRFGNVECTFLLPEGAEEPSEPSPPPVSKPAEKDPRIEAYKTAAIAFGATVVVAGLLVFIISLFF